MLGLLQLAISDWGLFLGLFMFLFGAFTFGLW